MLLLLEIAGARIGDLAVRLASLGGGRPDPDLARWMAYTLVIAVWVYFMYAGQTLSFAGTWPPNRVTGTVFDVTAGLLNGWLVIGTWWFYSDELGYPFDRWGLYGGALSNRAVQLLRFTPQAVIPDGYGTVLVGAILILLIALRVFR